MGKTAIVKIMERAAGRPVSVGQRVWCKVDLASATRLWRRQLRIAV